MYKRNVMTSDHSAEKTEVLYGAENTISRTLQAYSKTKDRLNICTDFAGPSVMITTRPIREKCIELKNKGVRIRFITEITKGNISYCKELMKLFELRHLDEVKGSFGVTDTEYGGSATVDEAKPLTQLIISNVKAFVEQQQYFFETLWNKAIPAEQRIREIEEGTIRYQSKILDNPDAIFDQMVHLGETSSELSIVSTIGGMRLAHEKFLDVVKKVLDNYRMGKGRGIKWVTTIDRDSIDLAKIFLNLGMEIRHVKNIYPVNFAVGDGEIQATIEKMEGGKMVQSLLTSNEPIYVNHFRSIFEEFWNSGIDARERISIIEEGLDTEGIEIIRNPFEMQKLGWELIKSAGDEILIMLSTANAFLRQVRVGTMQLLEEVAERGIRIRILVPMHELIKEITQIERSATN